ncbi:hypothetical protein [Nonomuraea sp. NPDC049750]|uniref:hypothetical protein n=1 Tax=Nonomuraea sp. NPDC049750 TaxID=3154738 RepID=UPI0033CC16A1
MITPSSSKSCGDQMVVGGGVALVGEGLAEIPVGFGEAPAVADAGADAQRRGEMRARLLLPPETAAQVLQDGAGVVVGDGGRHVPAGPLGGGGGQGVQFGGVGQAVAQSQWLGERRGQPARRRPCRAPRRGGCPSSCSRARPAARAGRRW